MKFKFCALILAASFAAISATPQGQAAKPNFTGEWKMLADKSDFGPIPAPEKMIQKIQHDDPVLKVTSTTVGAQGERTADSVYSTDGKETTNKLMGSEAKSVTKWDGDTLVIDTKLSFQGSDVTSKQMLSLSPDGKTMTSNSHLNTPQGEFDMKVLLEKQAPGSESPAPSTASSSTKTPPAFPPITPTAPLAANSSPKATPALPPLTPAAPSTLPPTTDGKPNFTGTWKLAVDKSDFGPLPAPEMMTQKIQQDGSVIKVNTTQKGPQGETTTDMVYSTDGKETTNKFMGNDAKSVARWEGNNLIIDTKAVFQGSDVTTKATWTLSPDGKTINANTHIVAPQGEFDRKVVLEKQ